jgi:hypothetical protein
MSYTAVQHVSLCQGYESHLIGRAWKSEVLTMSSAQNFNVEPAGISRGLLRYLMQGIRKIVKYITEDHLALMMLGTERNRLLAPTSTTL